jgi:hypothetical protein
VSGQCGSMVEIAKRNGVGKQYVSRLIRLAFLAPEMVERIAAGHQPPELTAQALRTCRFDVPVDWAAQKGALGFAQPARARPCQQPTALAHLQAKSTAKSANREKSPKLASEARREQFSSGPAASDSHQMRVIRAEKRRIPKTADSLAEGVGFEPTSDFRRCRFSRPVPSTARPPLQAL